jgi:hypothetical protein
MAIICKSFENFNEIKTMTDGFSEDLVFDDTLCYTAIGNEQPDVGVSNWPDEHRNAQNLNVYSWAELKLLAQAKLSANAYKVKYSIEPGKTKTVDGITYVLVDLGLDEGDYDGFVFVYYTGVTQQMSTTNINKGGYVGTNIAKDYVDNIYNEMSLDYANDLKTSMKKVSVTCNSGHQDKNGGNTMGMSLYTHECYMFMMSAKELGVAWGSYQYSKEGNTFDYFTANKKRQDFSDLIGCDYAWWLRTAASNTSSSFYSTSVSANSYSCSYATKMYSIVLAFVIG